MYPFRMYGRIVQLYHYKVEYTENEETKTEYFPTEEEANYIADQTSGTVSEYDSTAFAWMDGIEVSDVPNTYGEAITIYEMGEEAYLQMKNAPTSEERLDEMEVCLNALLTGQEGAKR